MPAITDSFNRPPLGETTAADSAWQGTWAIVRNTRWSRARTRLRLARNVLRGRPTMYRMVIDGQILGQPDGGTMTSDNLLIRSWLSEESFYAIRLTDGEAIYGEFSWMTAYGPDDWTVAEESEHDEPTEYEIVRMVVEPIARRTFGVIPEEEEDVSDG